MLRILALTASPGDEPWRAALPEHAEARIARSAEEALAVLAHEPFDLVLCEPAALRDMLRSAGRQQAQLILERVGYAIVILERDGQVAWSNARVRALPAVAIEALRDAAARLGAELALERPHADASRMRRRTISVSAEQSYDLTVALLPDADAPGAAAEKLVALITDVSASSRLKEKINAIDAAGAELVRLDTGAVSDMDVGQRLALLESKIIRLSRELLHFNHFAVRVLDKATNRLNTVLAGGMSEEAKSLAIYATPDGNGISGYVAASGRSYICPDVSKDPRYLRGIDNAASSLTVPLRLYDEVVGTLNVESDRIAAFDEDDRQFAEIFGRYIAVALHILKLLAVERRAMIGEISHEVGAELSSPLNDIVTEAATLMEDYIGHDDLRLRLHAIIDTVDRVKRTIQSMTRTAGILGLIPDSTPRDPVFEGKKILVAEDEDAIRETLANVLTDAGALTVTAADGEHAVAMIHAQQFDVVISDINLPHRTGYQIFEEAKRTNAACPVIFITGFGYDPEHNILKAAKAGLAGVLYKPFKIEKLLDQIRHALGAPAAESGP